MSENISDYKEELYKEESVKYFLNLEISDIFQENPLFKIEYNSDYENKLNNNNIPNGLKRKLDEKLRIFGQGEISSSVRRDEEGWIIEWKRNEDGREFKREFLLKREGENFCLYERDTDFVKLIREKIIDVQIPDPEEKEWNEFIEETKEIRKILAISHTILDLLLFFSDFSANMDEHKRIDEHKRRVRNYANLLNLRRKIDDEYIKKLKNFIKDKSKKYIIVVPMFPNISIQSFNILSELKWFKELLVKGEGENKSLRENIEIHLLFLNKPYLNALKGVFERKMEYFLSYSEHERVKHRREKLSALLKLNKLRIESFIKRYLVEYMLREIGGNNIRGIAQWLDKHVKVIDEEVNIEIGGKTIQITKNDEKNGVIRCDDEINKNIEEAREQNKKEVEECKYLSDVGVPEVLGYEDDGAYKDILYYLEKLKREKLENGGCIIINQSARALILYNFYINKLVEKDILLLGWDSYIPMIKPQVIPMFQYLSTLSRSFNYDIVEASRAMYNCDGRSGKKTTCYLLLLLEYLFKDILSTYGISVVNGPKCEECKCDTIIVKRRCNMCDIEHWMFVCPLCSKEYSSEKAFSDYLWLPMEIFYRLEEIFLNIPYTFMLVRRKYMPEMPEERKERTDESNFIISHCLDDPIPSDEEEIKEIKLHLTRQKEFLEKILENKDTSERSGVRD